MRRKQEWALRGEFGLKNITARPVLAFPNFWPSLWVFTRYNWNLPNHINYTFIPPLLEILTIIFGQTHFAFYYKSCIKPYQIGVY